MTRQTEKKVRIGILLAITAWNIYRIIRTVKSEEEIQ